MLLALLPSILSNLPSIVSFVETLFGGQAGKSTDKHAAAIQLLQLVVPELESALGANATIKTVVDGLIAIAVTLMQKNGTMPVATLPVAPVSTVADQPPGA